MLRRTSHTRFEAELEIGFRLFNERYVSDVSLVPGESVTAEAVRTPGGLFERLVSTWRFERGAHPRECVVKFDIDFRVGSVLHAQAVGLFFEEVSRMQINAFEARCVELYRGRAAGAVSGSSRVGGCPGTGGIRLGGANDEAIDGDAAVGDGVARGVSLGRDRREGPREPREGTGGRTGVTPTRVNRANRAWVCAISPSRAPRSTGCRRLERRSRRGRCCAVRCTSHWTSGVAGV